MFDNRDKIDFARTEIPSLFRSIFIPTLLGMVFNVAFFITDGIFVGHGVGPGGLAAVNLVCPVTMLMTATGLMFGVGCSVVAAIHLARNNEHAARLCATQAYIAGTTISLIVILLMLLFPDGILRLLGVSDALMPLAREYYYYVIPTCLFLMFQITGEFIIRLDGAPRFAMYANIIPAVINIILDYIFIIPCGWGLRGAAIATDIGTFFGFALTIWYMLFRARNLRLIRLKATLTSLRLSLRNIGYMIRMGASAFIGEMSVSVMILGGNLAFGRAAGDDGIAAYGIICYLFPVVYMIFNAIAQSAQPIISYNHGADLVQRVRGTLLHSVRLSLVFSIVMTVLFIFLSRPIITIFLRPDAAAHALAASGLPLYAAGFLFMSFNVSAIGYFQSVERSFFASLLMLLRGVIILLPAFFLPLLLNSHEVVLALLFLAVPIAELLTSAIALPPLLKAIK